MKTPSKIIITILGVALVILTQLNFLDSLSLEHTEKGLKRALVTYGVSRGLNGVISVAQGTEVAIEPVGVGLTFTPGQILDPINDLIERFSWVVLISGTSFGIQRILLEVTAVDIFSIFVAVVTVIALVLLWLRQTIPIVVKQGIYKFALILLIIRFSVPLIAIISENTYRYFLEPRYEASSQELLLSKQKLRDINTQTSQQANPVVNQEDKSLLDSAKDFYRQATNKVNIQQHIDDFKNAAETISEHAMNLIVIFVFQTLLIPLALIWLILQLVKWVLFRCFLPQ